MQRSLRWLQYCLFLAAGILLGYFLAAEFGSRAYQIYEAWRFDQQTAHAPASENAPSVPPSAEGAPSPLHEGATIGRLEIPSVHLRVMVLEGDGEKTLLLGAGHIPGTALPGQVGNIGIAGHRDTFFRALRGIRAHDKITLTGAAGTRNYVVSSTEIVAPSDVQVLSASAKPTLTLVTCYLFRYLGSAPKRFIVHAREMGPG